MSDREALWPALLPREVVVVHRAEVFVVARVAVAPQFAEIWLFALATEHEKGFGTPNTNPYIDWPREVAFTWGVTYSDGAVFKDGPVANTPGVTVVHNTSSTSLSGGTTRTAVRSPFDATDDGVRVSIRDNQRSSARYEGHATVRYQPSRIEPGDTQAAFLDRGLAVWFDWPHRAIARASAIITANELSATAARAVPIWPSASGPR